MSKVLSRIGIVVMVVFLVVGVVKIGARAVRVVTGQELGIKNKELRIDNEATEVRTIEVEAFRYKPDMLVLQAGQPYQLKFVTNNVYSCIRSLVIPRLGIREYLPATGEKIVQLPALQSGRYEFMCAMGMYRGTILVN